MVFRRSNRIGMIVLAALFGGPIAAGAATPSYATRGETIRGTIASVQNVNHVFVDDDRGFTDDVTLRAGAAVVSNGLRLEPGQRVTINGSAAGKTFLATRIATNGPSFASGAASPVSYNYPVAVPVYYSAPYYPAPIYYGSRPYYYGFGVSYAYRYRGYRPYYRPHQSYRPFWGGVYFRVHVR